MGQVNYKDTNKVKAAEFDAVIVGAGFAGAVVARELADGGKRVLILEKRPHIGGNMYDSYNDDGILIHNYGPHIFHTSIARVNDYMHKYSEMRPYEHRVVADWYGTYMPVPFNKTSMEIAFGEEKAHRLTEKLVEKFGDEHKVTINELRAENDADLAEVADFIYENVFLHYTMKQWGVTPEEVDPSVTARVPVFLSRDDRYFQDTYQCMPKEGYTALFENILAHINIVVCTGVAAESVFELAYNADETALDHIKIQGERFDKTIVFTGPLDEFFDCKFGRLPYRTLSFEFETLNKEQALPTGTVNYTVTEDFTRITEFKHLSGQKNPKTTIMREYSHAYSDPKTQVPYYAILSDENIAHYNRYLSMTKNLENFHAIGRLAEYKYYNMDVIIDRALDLSAKILEES